MVNYHFHDDRSSDATGPLRLHCEAALRAGLTELCVTNHVEVRGPSGDWEVELPAARARFDRVRRSVEEMSGAFPELRLRLGAELEYRREWRGPLEALAADIPFDFLLGSVHLVEGINVSGGDAPGRFFEGRAQAEAYGRYFDEVAEMVEWGAFDVVAHFDLVKRYGHRAYGPYDPAALEDRIRPVLRAMASGGIGIEVNTSGVFQAPGVPYPGREILAWAREDGVPHLTIGTDSHRPADLARGLREGFALARAAGWIAVTTFRERRPERRVPIVMAEAALGA